jgi:predicted transposase YbfD/YdcC
VREHWTVEVEHHIRDVSFGEDASTSRTGDGPTDLATLC